MVNEKEKKKKKVKLCFHKFNLGQFYIKIVFFFFFFFNYLKNIFKKNALIMNFKIKILLIKIYIYR